MLFTNLIAPLLVLVLAGQPVGQAVQHYVVLSPAESEVAAKGFPRWPRETVSGTWTLSQSDVDGLESNIPHIADIPFQNPAYKGSQIPHPERFDRQYVGIVLDNRKIIYVNALCEKAATNTRPIGARNMCLYSMAGIVIGTSDTTRRPSASPN